MPDFGVMEGWNIVAQLRPTYGDQVVGIRMALFGQASHGRGAVPLLCMFRLRSSWFDIFDALRQRALISGV